MLGEIYCTYFYSSFGFKYSCPHLLSPTPKCISVLSCGSSLSFVYLMGFTTSLQLYQAFSEDHLRAQATMVGAPATQPVPQGPVLTPCLILAGTRL